MEFTNDDWWCLVCGLGWADQDCNAMVDDEIVACPKCKGPLVDAGDVHPRKPLLPFPGVLT